jgi:hypothetical protein
MVFRDASEVWSLEDLRRRVCRTVQALPAHPSSAQLTDAFLWASAYEAGCADCGHTDAHAAQLTDDLSRVLGNGATLEQARASVTRLLDAKLTCPVHRPEGFAYYALWPCDVMTAARSLVVRAPVVVVGIRTVGVALSALVRVALEAEGHRVERLTVRPVGHPFDRRVDEDGHAVVQALAAGAQTFIVVDEGPGLSGSSFLSTAEWLSKLGVPAADILLLGTRACDPQTLLSPQAATRWSRFRSLHILRSPVPGEDLSSGTWRRWLPTNDWPAVWAQMERVKWFVPPSSGRPAQVAKFEGLGSYGIEAAQRAHSLWEAGFGPHAGAVDDRGMVAYAYLQGRRPGPGQVGRWLSRLAGYCWFRRRSFPSTICDVGLLDRAAAFNVEQELGTAWKGELPVLAPIIVDGRMQPWEWVQSDRGAGPLLKLDATSHGDDHFLPGPTDVAWDLAGTVVEWGMREDLRDEFLGLYGQLSGDRDLGRVAAFEVAYAAFRAAYCGMASQVSPADEQARLQAARQRYRRAGLRALLRW